MKLRNARFAALKRKIEVAQAVLESLARPDTWLNAPQTNIVFYEHDADQAELYEGLPFSRFTGPTALFLSENGKKFCQLARPFSKLTGHEAWANPYSMNRAALLPDVLGRLGLGRYGQKILYNNFRKFLAKVRPQVVFAVGADESLCEACRSLQIPVVEILHGRGYTYIPWGWEQRNPKNLPSHVISFDPTSTKTFSQLRQRGVQVLEARDIWPEFVQQHHYVSERKESLERKPTPVVLVTLQWGYAGDHGSATYLKGILENGLIPEFVLDLIADPSLNVKWLFRVHPVQLREARYAKHREFLDSLSRKYEHVEWAAPSTTPLPIVLDQATHHVTMSSMSTYEAAEQSIPTLLLCPTLLAGNVEQDLFEDLVRAGIATKMNWVPEQFLNWLSSTQLRQNPAVSASTLPDLTDIARAFLKGTL